MRTATTVRLGSYPVIGASSPVIRLGTAASGAKPGTGGSEMTAGKRPLAGYGNLTPMFRLRSPRGCRCCVVHPILLLSAVEMAWKRANFCAR